MGREFKACRRRTFGGRKIRGVHGPGHARGQDVEDFGTPVSRVHRGTSAASGGRVVHEVNPRGKGHLLCLHEVGKVSQVPRTAAHIHLVSAPRGHVGWLSLRDNGIGLRRLRADQRSRAAPQIRRIPDQSSPAIRIKWISVSCTHEFAAVPA